MILLYTKIVGLPIFDFRSQQKVGEVKDLTFQVKDFKVSGIVLEGALFQRKKRVISVADVIDIESQGTVINGEEAISLIDENLRMKEAIRSGYHGIGQKVVTRSGKSLGRVIDLFISTDTMTIAKIHVKGLFSEKIVSSSAIVEIKKRKIIVKDNFETIKIGAPAIGSSVI